MMHGKFRRKPILIVLVCFTLLGAGWFFLHRFQMKSIHSRFLVQATRAEEANPPQYDRALRFLRIYLLAKKDDTDALARYGVLMEEKSAQTFRSRSEALGIYERVLAQDPNRKDILMRAARLSLRLPGRIDDALKHAESLQKIDSLDPAVYVLLGECKLAQADPRREPNKSKRQIHLDKAEEYLRDAIRRAPHKLEPYELLALLMRMQEKRLEATKVLEDLIRANPESVQAHLDRAKFRQSRGDEGAYDFPILSVNILGLMGSSLAQGPYLSASALFAPETARGPFGAEQDLSIARKLAPDEADVLLASAVQELLWAQQKGQTNPTSRLDKARVYLQRGENLYPKDTRFLTQLAAVERVAGHKEKALSYLRIAQTKASGEERNRLLFDLANLLIDGDIDKTLKEAHELIDEMKKNRVPASRLEFLDARIAIRQGQWQKAAGLLQTARPMLANDPVFVMQVDLLLGSCFNQLRDADQQIATYQRAQQLDPLNPAPRYGLAMALVSLGRLDEAIDVSEELRSLPRSTGDAKLLSARLLIIKNIGLPEIKRDWTVVDNILKELAKQDNSTAREVGLLQAKVAAGQNKLKDAEKILKDAKQAWPEYIEPWIALADLETEPQKALRILDEANIKFGDRPELRLAKLNPRYMPEKKEEALAYLRPMSEKLDGFDRSIQVRLLVNLADAFERTKDWSEAERLWKKLVQLQPNELRTHLAFFDFYLRAGNADGMEDVLASIKRIEGGGDQPFGNYSKAQIVLFRAGERVRRLGKTIDQLTSEEKQLTSAETEFLKDARGYLNAARAKRPKWSRVAVGLAVIAEMEGNSELMTKHLRDAVEFGDRQPHVLKALVVRLQENRQWDEADTVARKLLEVTPVTDLNSQMQAAEISVFNQDPERALKLIELIGAMSDKSKNYQDHLWKGQMLGLLNRPGAEKSLQDAIDLAADEPGPRVALIQLHTRNGNREKATAALNDMKAKVPASKLPLALAYCYQILGDTDEAQKALRMALSGQPENLTVLKSAATFYLGAGKLKEAEISLHQMLELKGNAPEEERSWARRNLAMVLWFQKDPEKQPQAMKLIEENLQAASKNVDDQIVKGMLLATKSESRAEAIKILERAFLVKEPTPDQMFALANLYEVAGDWPKSRDYMVRLLSKSTKHEKYRRFLSAFVDKLMIREEVGYAEIWLLKLQESIVAHLKSQPSELLASRLALDTYFLAELARRHPRLASRILPSGAVLKSFAAETGRKESLLVLAEFFASCQRLEESLDHCEKVLKDLPPQQVLPVAVLAIATNEASLEQNQRVETWLISARKQKPELRGMDVYLAVLMERRASYSKAEDHYRIALKEAPESIMVLNNLAFLIGLQGKGDEAIFLIQKTIKKVGPAGELLDSRAAIYRVQGRLTEAEADIRDALRQQKTPARLFHLAQILKSAGKIEDSKDPFLESKRLGLRDWMLHPLERESYGDFVELTKKK
jgi:cellulose synthase operon protein C